MNTLAEGFNFTQDFCPLHMSFLGGADGVIFFLDFIPVVRNGNPSVMGTDDLLSVQSCKLLFRKIL